MLQSDISPIRPRLFQICPPLFGVINSPGRVTSSPSHLPVVMAHEIRPVGVNKKKKSFLFAFFFFFFLPTGCHFAGTASVSPVMSYILVCIEVLWLTHQRGSVIVLIQTTAFIKSWRAVTQSFTSLYIDDSHVSCVCALKTLWCKLIWRIQAAAGDKPGLAETGCPRAEIGGCGAFNHTPPPTPPCSKHTLCCSDTARAAACPLTVMLPAMALI